MKTIKEKVGSNLIGASLMTTATIILQTILKFIRKKIGQGRKPKQLKLPIKNAANDPSKF